MKNIIGYVMASAALAGAQVTTNPNGTFTCAVADKNYCAGDSLATDIIIRCSGTTGQPGRCSDNLAGEPPLGDSPALCWQSSPTSGDAACEKNCIVYAATGSFSLSSCTPTYTASTSTTSSTSSSATTTSSSATTTPATTWSTTTSCTTSPTITFTHPHYNTTWTTTPGASTTPIVVVSTTTTPTTSTSASTTTTSSKTAGPTGATGGAASHGAPVALVVMGIVAAYLI